MKKKILFLSYGYPYSELSPSTMCSVRVMNALCACGKYEVHCVSHKEPSKHAYPINPSIILHKISYKHIRLRNRFLIHLNMVLCLPIYPLNKLFSVYKHFKECKEICTNEHFDLIVSQCYPNYSFFVAVLLKKRGIIEKNMVIFWDNIYGKLPKRIIPKKFALSRQRTLENFVAKYADSLVSLYPIKPFHEAYGDVPNALGKRVYLGIPSIIRPTVEINGKKDVSVIKEGKINILYSGTIIIPKYIEYLVRLINELPFANDVNLMFFCKGMSAELELFLNNEFKGDTFISGFIPIERLHSMYYGVNVFLSSSGNKNSICSRCYEYISYCRPMIHVYGEDNDVNVSTFSKYPFALTIDQRGDNEVNKKSVEQFVSEMKDRIISFEEVETLFIEDTPLSYVNHINKLLAD